MNKDSDYFRVIEHLQRFQNDSDFHEIENLFGEDDNSFRKSKHYQRVVQVLAQNKFIEVKTGSGSSFVPMIIVGNHKGERHVIGGDKKHEYRPLMARIAFDGIKEYERIINKEPSSINVENYQNSIVTKGDNSNQSGSSFVLNPTNSPIIKADNDIAAHDKSQIKSEPGTTRKLKKIAILVSITIFVLSSILAYLIKKGII